MVTKKELAVNLADVPLFARCTKRDLRTIARHVEVVTIPAGTDVVTQGEPGETFFLVRSGHVDVLQDGELVNQLGPNDQFGELALLDPAPRSATVTTTTEAELAVLSVRMFRVLLRDMPQIAGSLLGSLAAQLRAG